jgi:4-hydroxy-tetrahydrodipicolinate synthase
MPAITTCFKEDLSVDHAFMARHANWLIEYGSTGIVALGSLGEGATLEADEKVEILKTLVAAVVEKVPVVAAISALATRQAVQLAQQAKEVGCKGLMVLPPYVYKSEWREMKAHVKTVIEATDLSCMLYNNPIAYGTDFLPEQIQELANEHANLHAVKESSADARRISAIRALAGDRLKIFVGVDDALVEGVAAGAVGWIAGLVNALPKESVDLFDYATNGEDEKAFELYRWFLPLLRLDTVPKFVQLIKLAQEEVGMGNARVRPPRLELVGPDLEETKALIQSSLKNRP